MNLTFDWISNWRVVVNVALNVLVFGAIGSLLAWLVTPPDIGFFSKVVLSAGFVPALSALAGKLQMSPTEQHTRDLTDQIQSGQIPGRRDNDRRA